MLQAAKQTMNCRFIRVDGQGKLGKPFRAVSKQVRQPQPDGYVDRTRQPEPLQFLQNGEIRRYRASPKISAFPMRRGELPVGSGKFLKNGLILVGSGRVY